MLCCAWIHQKWRSQRDYNASERSSPKLENQKVWWMVRFYTWQQNFYKITNEHDLPELKQAVVLIVAAILASLPNFFKLDPDDLKPIDNELVVTLISAISSY